MMSSSAHAAAFPGGPCDVVGRGRMGTALARALRDCDVVVRGPLGRGADGAGAAIVLLCVPETELAAASAAVAPGPAMGLVSASADLGLLAPHHRFRLHPLLSVIGPGASFAGAACSVEGSDAHMLGVAEALAARLGMRRYAISPERRFLYHAAASAASNYLTTVEDLAERLALAAGLDRAALLPLVQSAVDRWGEQGGRAALTGPVARGDEETVARQRDAVAAAAPDLLVTWDALTEATRALARNRNSHRHRA